MVLLEFSMTPLTMGESVSAYVARSLDIVDRSGLPYQLTPMGTILEGDFGKVMDTISQCHLRVRSMSERVTTTIRLDAISIVCTKAATNGINRSIGFESNSP